MSDTTDKKPPPKENPLPNPISETLDSFLSTLKALSKTYQLVLPHVAKWLSEEFSKNEQKLKDFNRKSDDTGKSIFQPDDAREEAELLATIRNIEDLGGIKIPETLQRSLFTQIFCEFDSFMGSLLKDLYIRKSDLLKGISRELTFVDLLDYKDLNAVKMDMLEKEIDSFRRESYIEQFSSLEKKFAIKTLRSFPEWGEFIELSQRRNLLVHNGGRISA